MTAQWHPFLATEERTPGTWTLVDTMGRDYGRVQIVRVGTEVGYTAHLGANPVGRYTTLKAALEAVHHAFIRSHAPGSAKAATYPIRTPKRAESDATS